MSIYGESFQDKFAKLASQKRADEQKRKLESSLPKPVDPSAELIQSAIKDQRVRDLAGFGRMQSYLTSRGVK